MDSNLARRLAIGILLILAVICSEIYLYTGGQVNLSEFWTIVAAELFIAIPGIIVWIVKPDFYSRILGRKPKHDMSYEFKMMTQQWKRFQDQPRRDAFTDQLQLVYRLLFSAVLEMKEGKVALPKGGTVGNYNNPWTLNPKIIAQVVDVFNKHLSLIENNEVRKGWEENKEYLRKGEFWYGERQRKWFESIEREHNRIRRERDSP